MSYQVCKYCYRINLRAGGCKISCLTELMRQLGMALYYSDEILSAFSNALKYEEEYYIPQIKRRTKNDRSKN